MSETAADRGPEDADPVAGLARSLVDRTPPASDANQALRILARSAMRMGPGLHEEEAQELVNEALTRIVRRSAGTGVTLGPERSAYAAYLYTTLRRVIVDHRRMAHRRHEVLFDQYPAAPELSIQDDAAAARLHRDATAASVRAALTRARAAGDTTAFQVGTYILDELQETGNYPSSRETGKILGVSHTAVAKALERLRTYIDPSGEATDVVTARATGPKRDTSPGEA